MSEDSLISLVLLLAPQLEESQETEHDGQEGKQRRDDNNLPKGLLLALRDHFAVEPWVVVDFDTAAHSSLTGAF